MPALCFTPKWWSCFVHRWLPSPGMLLLGPGCRISYLSPLQEHTNHGQTNPTFHCVASSSSFSSLSSPPVSPVFQWFKWGAPQSRDLVSLHVCEMPKLTMSAVPVTTSQRNHQGVWDLKRSAWKAQLHLFKLLIFVLPQNLGEPNWDQTLLPHNLTEGSHPKEFTL